MNNVATKLTDKSHIPQGVCGFKQTLAKDTGAILKVTFRKECVDLSFKLNIPKVFKNGHIPQGVCGFNIAIVSPLILDKRKFA